MSAKKAEDFRCQGCKKLLATGKITAGKITVKCKCGKVNTFEVQLPADTRPYQERMGIEKKDEHLSFEIKTVPERPDRQ